MNISFNIEQDSFRRLLKKINNKERVVPFVGAGLSIYGKKEERLPQWNELVELIKERYISNGMSDEITLFKINELIKNNNHIEAIDLLCEKLGFKLFRNFIEDILDTKNKPIPPAILELISYAWNFIVTTNLDTFIEDAWQQNKNLPLEKISNTNIERFNRRFNIHSTDVGHYLIKIHGTIEEYDSWILSDNHYQRILNNTKYIDSLKDLYKGNIFFVGYGLIDNDFEPLLKRIFETYPEGYDGEFFALLNSKYKGTTWWKNISKQYGINGIFYDTHDNLDIDRYKEVTECLNYIVNAWLNNKEVKQELKYFPELERNFIGRNEYKLKISEALFCSEYKSVQLIGFGGEGKTSLIQKWLKENTKNLAHFNYSLVYGCSFYKADIATFINDLYTYLLNEGLIVSQPEINISNKINILSSYISNNKVLFIFDGFEVILSDNGNIRNAYIEQLINNILDSDSALVFTSRIKINLNKVKDISLEELSYDEVKAILSEWNISIPDNEYEYIIENIIGRHALTVRIMADFIKREKIYNLNTLLEIKISNDIKDEADPLRDNKAIRVLNYYKKHMNEIEIGFMQLFSIFRKPIKSIKLIETYNSIFKHNINDDLLKELIQRRLLIYEDNMNVTSHPLIKEYFASLTSKNQIINYNSYIFDEYYHDINLKQINTNNIDLFIDASLHLAKSKRFEEFHKLYYKNISKDIQTYSGFVLGAWEETLYIISAIYKNERLNNDVLIYPNFYYGESAVCLKKLGRTQEAINHYQKCIIENAKLKDIETAKQVNNLLALYSAKGDFKNALNLINLNLNTISWINIEYKKYWQLEHAYISFGIVFYKLKEYDLSIKCFNKSIEIKHLGKHDSNKYHSLEGVYYSDALILTGNINLAEIVADENLQISIDNKWSDIECAAKKTKAIIELYKFHKSNEIEKLHNAFIMASEALELAKKRLNNELEIQSNITLALIQHQMKKSKQISQTTDIEAYIKRCKYLIEKTNLNSYLVQIYAIEYMLCKSNKEIEIKLRRELQENQYIIDYKVFLLDEFKDISFNVNANLKNVISNISEKLFVSERENISYEDVKDVISSLI